MIDLHPESKSPLYEQLYAALADEIRRGLRAPGTALPGRRTMAAQQGVSVNTVDAAYQMLAAEGLADARPRSGCDVQKTYGMLHRPEKPPPGTICLPAAWTRRCFRPAAGGASRRNCSTNGPNCCSGAKRRAMHRCGPRSPTTFRPTGGWYVRRSRS